MLDNRCNYLSMMGLKLNHVSKRRPRLQYLYRCRDYLKQARWWRTANNYDINLSMKNWTDSRQLINLLIVNTPRKSLMNATLKKQLISTKGIVGLFADNRWMKAVFHVLHNVELTVSLISNDIHYKVWNTITYPFMVAPLKFGYGWEISSYFAGHVVIYPYWDQS